MPIRVYECDRSEVESLKKVLKYDPYTDSSVIPPSAMDDRDLKKLPKEEQERIAKEDSERREKLKKLQEDRLFNIIFVRQEYDLRDGGALGLDRNKSYLYLNAPDQFLDGAEERFNKEFKTVRRADKAAEDKMISFISSEKDTAAAGFGSIFGG